MCDLHATQLFLWGKDSTWKWEGGPQAPYTLYIKKKKLCTETPRAERILIKCTRRDAKIVRDNECFSYLAFQETKSYYASLYKDDVTN